MSGLQASWTPDPFATQFDRRDDGSLILRPLGRLAPAPERLIDHLVHWAAAAPDRVLVARRAAGGDWREVNYAQMLHRVRRIAGGLASRGLSAERPVAILSGNGIEHLTLALACIWDYDTLRQERAVPNGRHRQRQNLYDGERHPGTAAARTRALA